MALTSDSVDGVDGVDGVGGQELTRTDCNCGAYCFRPRTTAVAIGLRPETEKGADRRLYETAKLVRRCRDRPK